MFTHLLPIGAEMNVLIIPSSDPHEKKVKSDGGCFGILADDLDLPQGTTITAKIIDIKDGQPVFEPTPEWKLAKLPQKARVLFITPVGLALELETGGYVTYAPKGMPEELKGIKDGQTVMVVGLKPMADQMLSAAKVWIPEPADSSEANLMIPWSEQKINEVVAQGSRKVRGKARLGKVYSVEVTSDRCAKLSREDMVELRSGYFPQVGTIAFVRVVFIDQNNKIYVEVIKTANKK